MLDSVIVLVLQGFWPVAVRRDRRVSVSPALHYLSSLVQMKLKHDQRLYINEGIRCHQASLALSACLAEGLEDFLVEHFTKLRWLAPHLI